MPTLGHCIQWIVFRFGLGFFVIVFMPLVCVSQMRNIAVPQDDPLGKVRTVAVFINIGQALHTRYVPDFDRAKKQIAEKLDKAGLTVVADPKDADAVLVVDEYDTYSGSVSVLSPVGNTGMGLGNTFNRVCLADGLRVYAGGTKPTSSDTPIWLASDACGVSWPLNRIMDRFLKALKKSAENNR